MHCINKLSLSHTPGKITSEFNTRLPRLKESIGRIAGVIHVHRFKNMQRTQRFQHYSESIVSSTLAYSTANRKKSISSHVESISACRMFLPLDAWQEKKKTKETACVKEDYIHYKTRTSIGFKVQAPRGKKTINIVVIKSMLSILQQ